MCDPVPQYHFKTFRVGSSQKQFKEPVLIDVVFEEDKYVASNDDLGLLVAASSMEAVVAGVEEEFGILWFEYVQADVGTLTAGARKFREMLVGLVENAYMQDVPEVEPEDDEIEAIRAGRAEFAAGESAEWGAVRTRSEPQT